MEAMIHGIDVSQWQGTIDWEKVGKATVDGQPIRFAFVRAACGEAADPEFVRNVHGALAAGLAVGAYQYGTGAPHAALGLPMSAGTGQAEVFLRMVGHAGGPKVFALPPVLDLEAWPAKPDRKAILEYLRAWSTAVGHNAWPGGKPMIYSDPGFWNPLGLPGGQEGDFAGGVWVADYGAKEPENLAPWDRWRFWQYSNQGRVDGIDGAVDLDLFDGTEDDLFKAKRGAAVGSEGTVTWTVRPGQSLTDIAQQYLPTETNPLMVANARSRIMEANGMTRPAVKAGDRLKIPQPL